MRDADVYACGLCSCGSLSDRLGGGRSDACGALPVFCSGRRVVHRPQELYHRPTSLWEPQGPQVPHGHCTLAHSRVSGRRPVLPGPHGVGIGQALYSGRRWHLVDSRPCSPCLWLSSPCPGSVLGTPLIVPCCGPVPCPESVIRSTHGLQHNHARSSLVAGHRLYHHPS